MGIEPTTAAWEAAVLPLNYIRIVRGRFAPEGGIRRCNDYFTTNAQKVNRFSENCREAPSRGATRCDRESLELNRNLLLHGKQAEDAGGFDLGAVFNEVDGDGGARKIDADIA